MSITTQRTTDPTTTSTAVESPSVPDAPRVVEDPHRRRALVLVGGLAVVTAVAVGTWIYVGTRPAAAPAAAPVVATPWTSGYGPGSATYGEQVPRATTPDHSGWHGSLTEWPAAVPGQGDRSWADAYGPGSTTYEEQVPQGDRSWADAIGAGTVVSGEQIPHGTWVDGRGPGSDLAGAAGAPSKLESAPSPERIPHGRWVGGHGPGSQLTEQVPQG